MPMKLIRFLLFPVALIYDLVTRIRNYFFDVGFLKSTSFPIPTLVVGNLSVGGTGKTPQIEYLIRLLKEKYKIAILSRGYKRKTEGFVLVDESHIAEDVGDEPLQYFKKFSNLTVAVDANRVNGIQQLIAKKSPEIILLDDAYQHRKVKAGFYILLTKYNDLYTDDFILPSGNLRESKTGAKRANLILVTKCPINLSEIEKNKIVKHLNTSNGQKVFFTSIAYSEKLKGSESIALTELVNFQVLLITGIANPNPLLEFLSEKNIRFKHLKFADHHPFSDLEIKNIEEEFVKIKSDKKLILTTEKDFVRLSEKVKRLSYLEIKTQFLFNADDSFNEIILSQKK